MKPDTHTIMELHPPELARVIAISNGAVNGENSAIPVNIAVCLAQLGKKVCLYDASSLSPERLLLSDNAQMHTMDKLLNGEIGIESLIHEGPAGIKMIPHTTAIGAYPGLSSEKKENLLFAITQLQHEFDYLLLDTSAQINKSTISFLLGSGSIVITVTSDGRTLSNVFALLKSIKLRTFKQPVKVVVNLVSIETEAKHLVARLSLAVRKYLGSQCGSLSFFIINDQILKFISQDKLITLEYPNSLPSYCLKNIALRLAEEGQAESLMLSNHLSQPAAGGKFVTVENRRHIKNDASWQAEALHSVRTAPLADIEPVMQQLNEIWQKRKMMKIESQAQTTSFELEILKLKTAIHFASHANPVNIKDESGQQ